MGVQKWLGKAREEERKTRWQAAANLYQKVLAQDKHNGEAVHGLGQLLLRANQLPQAYAVYQPLYEAGKLCNNQHFCGFAQVLRKLGRLQQAANIFQRVVEQDESFTEAWLGLGEVLTDAGDHVRAAGSFKRLMALKPDEPYYAALYARALIESHRYGLARAVIKRLCQRMPSSTSMKFAHADILSRLGQNLLAIDVLGEIERNSKTAIPIDMLLAQACMQSGNSVGFEQATGRLQQCWAELSEVKKNDVTLWQCRSLLQKGDKREAAERLLDFITTHPEMPMPWQLLADSLPGYIDDGLLSTLKAQIESAQDVAAKSSLLFSLGMVLEHRGERADEVAAYEQANAVAEPIKPYYPEGVNQVSDYVRGRYRRAYIKELAEGGDSEFRPIFIIGMPRSGTTLLEQVLGAHPEVDSAGESTVMECVVNDRMATLGMDSKADYFAGLDASEIRELAAEFRNLITKVAGSDSLFIAEKGMNNPRDAGLLAAMFPRASFVYIKRHPLDIAWGCFKQNFSTQNFSFSYSGIASQFANFKAMVDFWRGELPSGLYELSYERLVGDMRETVAGLLKHVGLPWDDACLAFDKQEKEVVTASMNQIRQGLFSSAVGRWQKYGELLNPLISELQSCNIALEYEE